MNAWSLACPDWEERLRTGRSLVPDLPLNLAEGERAVKIFNKLRLFDVPGTPTMAEAGGEWFRDIVRAIFGAVDSAGRERLIRELFLLVPKKNSKTTNGALLTLTALLMNERPYAPLLMTAPVHDTAEMAYAAARGAIELDPVLRKRMHVRDHLKTIIDRETKADLRIMTFDPVTLTGQKPVFTLVDELHVVAKMAKAPSAIRQLRGGMLPFPEAFLAFITTQSEEPPAGVFRAELMKARAIRDGRQDGIMLPVLYEFPEAVQREKSQPWRDPKIWSWVTPNAGRSISIDRLVQDMRTAEQTSEAELRAWASQHLNVEIGLALMSDSWPGALFWEENAIAGGLTLEDLIRRCDVAAVGIDGGGLDDLLGLVVLGRDRETGDWLAWARAWAHKIVLDRRREIAQQLLDFQAAGDLTIAEQIGRDVDELADIVEQVHAAGLLNRASADNAGAIGVDPIGIGAILDALEARGIPKEAVIGISQGWKLAGAIKTTERRLAEGRLKHAGAPFMAWCVGNAKIEPRANSVLITKQASGTAKIDPLMALFDAVSLMALLPEGSGKSFWETMGQSPEKADPSTVAA